MVDIKVMGRDWPNIQRPSVLGNVKDGSLSLKKMGVKEGSGGMKNNLAGVEFDYLEKN